MTIAQQLCFHLFLCTLSIIQSIAQAPVNDSARYKWEDNLSNEENLSQLMESVKKLSEDRFELAADMAQEGVRRSQSATDPYWKARFEYQLGTIYRSLARYDSAIIHLDKAIEYFREINDAAWLGKSLLEKATVLKDNGDFTTASELLFEVLPIFESINDQVGVGDAYVLLCFTMFYQERVEDGIKYGQAAVDVFEQIGNQEGLASAYQQLSGAYISAHDYPAALETIEQALTIKRNLDVPLIQIGSLENGRGNVLKYLERYEEALEAYHESLRITQLLHHAAGQSASLGNLGDVYTRMGDYQRALPLMLESTRLAEEYGFRANLYENLRNLTKIYQGLGDYENAFIFSERSRVQQDSILSAEKDQIARELTVKYETAQKDKAIEQKDLQIRQQQKTQLMGLILLLLIAIILIGLYIIYARNKRFSQKLQQLNQDLASRNEEKELLLKEIHHRVKNNLQIISSLLNSQFRSVQDQEIKGAILESQTRVQSMSLIHQKLYRGSNLASVEMKSYFESLSNNLVDAYADQEIIEVNLNMPDLELDVDYAIPLGLIANELITNSLKYAFPTQGKGIIDITIVKKQNEIVMDIGDNGTGNSVNSISSNNGGFGSELVEMLTIQLKGKLVQQTKNGFHTQLRFPYKHAA